MTSNPLLTTLVAVVALAAPGTALAQDPGEPESSELPELIATINAPKTVSKATLQKGLTVRITCSRTCNSQVQLVCTAGIITKKSGPAGTFKLKATKPYLKTIKKGDRVTVVLNARAEDGAIANVRRDVKVK